MPHQLLAQRNAWKQDLENITTKYRLTDGLVFTKKTMMALNYMSSVTHLQSRMELLHT